MAAPTDEVLDAELMAYASSQWRKMNFLALNAMASLRRSGTTDVSDVVMLDRLRALITAGRLEVTGDPLNNHYCEVRLPTGSHARQVDE